MKDPVFGNLEYEYGWNGTVEFNCFGRMEEIALTVSGEEDDPITEYQYNSFRAFMETWERIMSDTAEAIKEYYLGLRKELGYDQEYNADYPPLDHTESILKNDQPRHDGNPGRRDLRRQVCVSGVQLLVG